MSVKTVTLSEDPDVALGAGKREGESFTEVVRRLARIERSLREFVGGWEDVPAAKLAPCESWMRHSDSTSRSETMRLGRRPRNGRTASLDPTCLFDLLRGVPAAVDHLDRLDASREPRLVAPPAAAEVLVGAHRIADRSPRVAKDLLRSLPRLEFDREACRLAGRIEADPIARGEPMGAPELLIAAATLRHGNGS